MALLTYYKLDGDSYDSSGNDNHAVISGSAKYVSGINKKGLNFDGVDSKLIIPATAVDSSTGSLAISFWAKTVCPRAAAICRKVRDSDGGYNLNIYLPYLTNNNIYWDIGNNTSSYNRINSTINLELLSDDKYHHYVFQLDSVANTQQIYVDSNLFLSGTSKTIDFVNSTQDLEFGHGSTNYWAGSVDEIKIWDQPLSVTEIKTEYDEFKDDLLVHIMFPEYKKYIDYSSHNNKVWNRGTNSGDGKKSKYCAYFDGDTSTYLKVQLDKTPKPPVTWSCWVMKNRHTVSSYPIFQSFGLPYMACSSSTSAFRTSYTSGTQVSITGTTIPVLNTWYLVTTVFSETDTKLYINGELEATSSLVCEDFDGSSYDIGRHYDNDTYRMWGRVDDARLYTRALDEDEIRSLYNYDQEKIKLSLKNNGDYICEDFEEDVEWELLDNFQSSNLDGGTTSYDTAIGGNNITNLTTLQAAGWTTYVGSFDITSYTRKKGYLQMYYSGSPIGYIQKALPSGYDRFKVVWGNWYSGTARFKIDGVTIQSLAGNYKDSEYGDSYTGNPVIRFEESGIFWVSEVWVGKSKDNKFSVPKDKQSSSIVNNRIAPNNHSYSSWTLGSGSVGDFNINGSTTENVRVIGGDPWEKPIIRWECRPDSTSGADGGWNHNKVDIDNKKMYRYSVWVRRNSTTDGRFYHGMNGYNSAGTGIAVKYIDATTTTTNPYFYNSITGIPANAWYLVIGHIWPYGTAVRGNHPNSGIYNSYEKYTIITRDFVWTSTHTQARGRNYLYYSTNTSQRQWLTYPIWEVCDGTESPIQDLISGRAYEKSGMIPEENIDMEGLVHRIKDSKLYISGKLIIK